MDAATALDLRADATIILEKLLAVLRAEGEDNWVRGIREAYDAATDPALRDVEALARVASIYSTMTGGPGGFDDWFVWRDSVEERQAANREFEESKAALWRIVERVKTAT